jgi:hypothetical protein
MGLSTAAYSSGGTPKRPRTKAVSHKADVPNSLKWAASATETINTVVQEATAAAFQFEHERASAFERQDWKHKGSSCALFR